MPTRGSQNRRRGLGRLRIRGQFKSTLATAALLPWFDLVQPTPPPKPPAPPPRRQANDDWALAPVQLPQPEVPPARAAPARLSHIDESWLGTATLPPVRLARFDAPHVERSTYRQPRQPDDSWFLPALTPALGAWFDTPHVLPRSPRPTPIELWLGTAVLPPVRLARFDAPHAERVTYQPPRQTQDPWFLLSFTPALGAWFEATPPPAPRTRASRVDEPWTEPPVREPWTAPSPERSSYKSPRQPDELWSQPPIETSAAPWEEVENPERSTYDPPRQPPEAWSQPPVETSAAPWAAPSPERSTYQRPQQPPEHWAQPPVTESAAPWAVDSSRASVRSTPRVADPWSLSPVQESPATWEEIANPERSGYVRPEQPDELWTEPPVRESAAPWATDPPRPAALRSPQIVEPWSQPPAETSASPWEQSENPERSTYEPPRKPDDPWAETPVIASAAPWASDNPRPPAVRAPRVNEPWQADPPTETSAAPWATTDPRVLPPRVPHAADSWSDPPVEASAATWEEIENPTRSRYEKPRPIDEPWSDPPFTASAEPWAVDPIRHPRPDFHWRRLVELHGTAALDPFAAEWNVLAPVQGGYRRPRQPEDAWFLAPVTPVESDWEHTSALARSVYHEPFPINEPWWLSPFALPPPPPPPPPPAPPSGITPFPFGPAQPGSRILRWYRLGILGTPPPTACDPRVEACAVEEVEVVEVEIVEPAVTRAAVEEALLEDELDEALRGTADDLDDDLG